MDYLDPLTLHIVGDRVSVSDSITKEAFSMIPPKFLGASVDQDFANAIARNGLKQGELTFWEIRPWILGFGYVQDWTKWDGFRVFGTYQILA